MEEEAARLRHEEEERKRKELELQRQKELMRQRQQQQEALRRLQQQQQQQQLAQMKVRPGHPVSDRLALPVRWLLPCVLSTTTAKCSVVRARRARPFDQRGISERSSDRSRVQQS